MKIHGRTWLIAATIVVLLGLLALRWVAQPNRVAKMILTRAGTALGLEITATGANEYRLLGTPMLVVRDVLAKQPGAATPLLRAERIYLTLPWSTIRAGGADMTVERIELDAPQLDIAALQRWLATRPPGETRVPTLTDGLQVDDGRVTGEGWSIEAFDLELPELYPQRRMHAQVSGRVVAGDTRLPFDVHAVLVKPAIGAGFGLAGQLSVESGDWKLPMKPVLGGRLHSNSDGIGLDRMKLEATARYVSGDTDLPVVFGLAGALRYREGALILGPAGCVVRGRDPIPALNAHCRIEYGAALSLQLAGEIADWPESWPALPPPIGASSSPLSLGLGYVGKPDFSDIAILSLQRDHTHFDGRFRLPAITAWIDAGAAGSPLPPLDGRMSTPALEVSGAQLQGVEIEVDDPSVAGPAVQ